MNKQEKYDRGLFASLSRVQPPNWLRVLANIFGVFFLFNLIILSFTPWQQTSQGSGRVIAFDPNDRVQNINSTVPGLVSKWHVKEGEMVKKGQEIVQIIDNDPKLIERLRLERNAIDAKLQAAKAASETAYLNYKRQEDLLKQGLSARTKFEKAKIQYKNLLASEATAAANLAKADVRLSRQQNQLILAPRDGTILRVIHGSGSVYVKEGDVLATFVPKTVKPAVEIYIDGNDLPLINTTRRVRLQFEGWPAVQLSGWPSMAIGTFGGIVSNIDPSASSNGKFRVLVVPDENDHWPSSNYIRQGARVYGWILLNNVKLGYELWRQFNGFPADQDGLPDDFIKIKKSYDDSIKSKDDDKDYKEYKGTYKGN